MTVAVFAEGDAARAAEEAGADHVGAADLAEKIEGGWTDFDVAISTPALMGPVVSKLGRVLGPQGKMPNPKVGTVTDDVAKAVGEAKAGKIEYRTDRQAIVHLTIGKASFEATRAARELRRRHRRDRARQARGGQGPLPRSRSPSPRRWAPGIRVDPSRVRHSEVMAESRRAGRGRRRRNRGLAAAARSLPSRAPTTSPAEDRWPDSP